MIINLAFFITLGLIVGSFLNVAILRYNTGKSLGGRSGCFSCRHPLSWLDLIPVFSFLFLRGRCRYCGSRISAQYPLVELLTATLFGLVFYKFYPDYLSVFFYAMAVCLFLLIVVYDLRHKIIPNIPLYTLIGLGFIAPFLFEKDLTLAFGTIGSNILAGVVIFSFFFLIWFFSRGRAMGFGDAKLGFAIGVNFGLVPAANSVVLGFWVGAIVGLLLIALSRGGRRWRRIFGRRFSAKSELPFAPFLALGVLLHLFFGIIVLYF